MIIVGEKLPFSKCGAAHVFDPGWRGVGMSTTANSQVASGLGSVRSQRGGVLDVELT